MGQVLPLSNGSSCVMLGESPLGCTVEDAVHDIPIFTKGNNESNQILYQLRLYWSHYQSSGFMMHYPKHSPTISYAKITSDFYHVSNKHNELLINAYIDLFHS